MSFLFVLGSVVLMTPARCSPATKNVRSKVMVVPAPEWTELFNRTSGWTGADGVYSIPYSGYDAPAPLQKLKPSLPSATLL